MIITPYYITVFLLLVIQLMHFTRIRHAIETQCDTNVESSLHTHSVSTADVIKAVKRLKTDKYNNDGIMMSKNFQH